MSGLNCSEYRFGLPRPDGATIAAYRWSAGGDGFEMVVVVAHGMGEHARRYPEALQTLMSKGICLYGVDHRGHGVTAALSAGELGDFGPEGISSVVEDLHALVRLAKDENPNIPIVLLGHSMGSFISQLYVQKYSDHLDGLVLVGTTAVDTLVEGLKEESDVMAAFNRAFEPARTPCDWLSACDHEVDLYLNDPLCGFSLNEPSMMSLFGAAETMADPDAIGRIRKDLPVYVLVGAKDPLISTHGTLDPLLERYRKAGLVVDLASYPEGRHEILNEVNRDEVVLGLHAWLNGISR